MNDEPDRRIVVPTIDDLGGHHDALRLRATTATVAS